MEPFARLAQRVGKDDQLTPTARLVFAALDAFMDKKTGRCAPTVARLAGWIGRGRRAVLRALAGLEAAGYVEVIRASGRRNAYRLLPGTGATNDTGTGATNGTGTGAINGTGSGPPTIPESRTRGKEPMRPRAADLFAGHYREWMVPAIREHLAGCDLADWFPPLVTDFFLAQSWHRETDPETAAAWGRRLAGFKVTPDEVDDAFRWALGADGFDPAGRRVFSRPDHLARIVYRVQTQRKRRRGPPAGALNSE